MSQYTVGWFLFDYIHSKGVKHCFGIPGDFALPTFRYLEQSPIDIITMSHEPAVGFAADAYARVNGLGLCCVTYCVGGLNMLNSVACAYAEKSPIIVISGGPSPTERRDDKALIHHKVKTFDTQRRIFEEVTCANTVLSDPETAAAEIMRVVDTVMEQCRPGYIEVPYDLVEMPIEIPRARDKAPEPSDPAVMDICIEDAVEFINKAKQPVIIAGEELHRHNWIDKAVQLAEKFNIPIAATMLSKSVIRETNPLYIGVFSSSLSDPKCKEYVDNSDCVILLGTFISDVFMGFSKHELNRSNSILVTTEKARIGFRSYDDIRLDEFLDTLSDAKLKKRPAFNNPNPAKKTPPPPAEDRKKPLTVNNFFAVLEQHLDDGSTLCCDVGDALIGALGIRTNKRRNFVADAYYLSMGFAVPAAIGVLANQQEEGRVFAIVGDGAFQMTGMELSTAAKFGFAPIVLVMNNDGYGTQRHIIDGPFNDIQRWQYHKITDLIGAGKSAVATTPEELDKALEDAVKCNVPYVIEAILPRDDCSDNLKRLGEELSSHRDSSKRAKKVEAEGKKAA